MSLTTDTAAEAAAKSPATSITLARASGPYPYPDPVTHAAPGCWTAAGSTLRQWARTAPRGGAYDKIDFTIAFEDGTTYTGRYDLEHGDSGDLADHVRGTATWHANPDNLVGADHIDPTQWQGLLERLRFGD